MAQKLSDKKLAVLGTGKLGGILLRAYLSRNSFRPARHRYREARRKGRRDGRNSASP